MTLYINRLIPYLLMSYLPCLIRRASDRWLQKASQTAMFLFTLFKKYNLPRSVIRERLYLLSYLFEM